MLRLDADPAPTASALRPGEHRRRSLVALLTSIALVLAVAVACSSAPAATSGGGGGDENASGASPSKAPPPEPDKLADPGVGVGQCKQVTYTPPTAKQAIIGELCRPKENQRDVAVIVVHGGSGIGGSYDGMRRWANRYLVEGYVTFLPEYHLFNVGGEQPVFPRPEQNIKAAVQYVRGVGNALGIRKDRIVVQGQSAGARIGAVAYTTSGDPWFRGPEMYPDIADDVNGFIGFYHPYDGTMQYAYQYFGGDDSSRDAKVIERLMKGDSLSLATNAKGPAIFINGSNDWDVIDKQQDAFVDALHAKGLSASAVIIKGGGHGFDEGGSRLSKLGEEAAISTLRFLNDSFPQDPVREPQAGSADVASAPTYTGVPPSTYATRPTSPGGYTNRQPTRTTVYAGPTTTKAASPTSTVPSTTVPPSSVVTEPPTTAPTPTTVKPKPTTTEP